MSHPDITVKFDWVQNTKLFTYSLFLFLLRIIKTPYVCILVSVFSVLLVLVCCFVSLLQIRAPGWATVDHNLFQKLAWHLLMKT